MLRKAASKVLWIGRATSTVLGLAVILALILGVATAALGATSKAVPFNLGQINTSNVMSTLVGAVSGSNLKIENTNTDPNANPTALELKVPAGKAPMKVNADAGTATNLNADQVDGKSDTDFYAARSTVDDSDKLDGLDSSTFMGSSLQRIESVSTDTDSTDRKSGSATCPAGTIAISGGGIISPMSALDKAPISLQEDIPPDPSWADPWSRTWQTEAVETSAYSNNWALVTYVLCASVPASPK